MWLCETTVNHVASSLSLPVYWNHQSLSIIYLFNMIITYKHVQCKANIISCCHLWIWEDETIQESLRIWDILKSAYRLSCNTWEEQAGATPACFGSRTLKFVLNSNAKACLTPQNLLNTNSCLNWVVLPLDHSGDVLSDTRVKLRACLPVNQKQSEMNISVKNHHPPPSAPLSFWYLC